MLERCYRDIDVSPVCYPFKENTRSLFPSSQWESHSKSTYTSSFRPGASPTWPEMVLADPARCNKPQSNAAYHIYKINHDKVCDVTSILTNGKSSSFMPTSTTHSTFTTKTYGGRALRRRINLTSRPNRTRNIVPEVEFLNPLNERMLPACGKVVTMTTTPALQYTGRKKKVIAPFSDAGIFYTSYKPAIVQPESVTSLAGKPFTRRRRVSGKKDTLLVKAFNGGASGDTSRSFRRGCALFGINRTPDKSKLDNGRKSAEE